MISALDLQRAFSRTEGYRSVTPLISKTFLDELWDCEVFLKCEQLQSIGAFKIRGAANFSLRLTADELKDGLITHSSGNHAQAVAYMAKWLGVKARVVMPDNSNRQKIENARKWGAEIHLCEPTIQARINKSNQLVSEFGGTIIPPFDHEWIIEGQATCAMEILSQEGGFDYLFTPLGGGGLLAGTALAAKYFSNNTKVIGAEPENASDGFIGFRSGIRQENVTAKTVADGLRTTVGEAPFSIIKKDVENIWLAEEELIVPWMYRMWKETKMLIEPSCAVPFVAIDQNKEKVKGKKIAIVITGGNVDVTDLPHLVA